MSKVFEHRSRMFDSIYEMEGKKPFVLEHPKWAPNDRGKEETCAFDVVVKNLGLESETVEEMARPNGAKHQALRQWVERNRTRRYVPEYLLFAWDIPLSEDEAISPGGNWK